MRPLRRLTFGILLLGLGASAAACSGNNTEVSGTGGSSGKGGAAGASGAGGRAGSGGAAGAGRDGGGGDADAGASDGAEGGGDAGAGGGSGAGGAGGGSSTGGAGGEGTGGGGTGGAGTAGTGGSGTGGAGTGGSGTGGAGTGGSSLDGSAGDGPAPDGSSTDSGTTDAPLDVSTDGRSSDATLDGPADGRRDSGDTDTGRLDATPDAREGGFADATDGSTPIPCPNNEPRNDSACLETGRVCQYGDDACLCHTAGANDFRWRCLIGRDAGPGFPECPGAQPTDGTPCTDAGAKLACGYPMNDTWCFCNEVPGYQDRWHCF